MLVFTENRDHDKIYVLIHIPKNSGRYMRTEIKNRFKIVNKINDLTIVNPEIKDEMFYVPLHNNSDIVLLAHFSYQQFNTYNFHVEKFFVFTRNPYDRFLSGYFYCLKLDILKLILTTTKKFTLAEIEYYSKDILLSCSKDEFAEKLKNFIRIIKEMSNTNLEHPIFKPQYKYFIEDSDNDTISNDVTIYKLEDYETNTEAQSFFNFEGFKLKMYNYTDYYDDECLSIINEVYKKDFELLGYIFSK
jgi:hypothetical protein